MEDAADLIPKMRSAFEIFAEELERHLEVLSEISVEGSAAGSAKELRSHFEDSAKRLEHRFHVLKGGAGFLKLKRIAELSTSGESWFKGAQLQRSDLEELQTEYSSAVAELKVELGRLKKLLIETPSG